MSLCDKCFAPGACCKRLFISSGADRDPLVFWDDEPESIQAHMVEWKYPFVVNERLSTWTADDSGEDAGRSYSSYNYNCKNLLPNGRCGDYENRPDLCRTFEPASDELCVHWRGAEAGDPTVDITCP